MVTFGVQAVLSVMRREAVKLVWLMKDPPSTTSLIRCEPVGLLHMIITSQQRCSWWEEAVEIKIIYLSAAVWWIYMNESRLNIKRVD